MSSAVNTGNLLPIAILNKLSDEDLIARFRETQCRAAIDELVRRYLGNIRAMIYPMVLNHTSADDLTQEVFLRAWKGLKGFRAEARFSTWLRCHWRLL